MFAPLAILEISLQRKTADYEVSVVASSAIELGSLIDKTQPGQPQSQCH